MKIPGQEVDRILVNPLEGVCSYLVQTVESRGRARQSGKARQCGCCE